MGELTRDITAILSAVVGLAIITVLVRGSSQTAEVISAGAKGFSGILNAAMGSGNGFASFGG